MANTNNTMVPYTLLIRKDQREYLDEVIAKRTGNVSYYVRRALDEKKERDNLK